MHFELYILSQWLLWKKKYKLVLFIIILIFLLNQYNLFSLTALDLITVLKKLLKTSNLLGDA